MLSTRYMLSSTCTYGIRAVVYLAAQPAEPFVPVRQIADALGLSTHFLSKVFHRLATAGIIETYRGPNGGARLARPSDTINLRDLVEALDGHGLFRNCVLGLEGCGEQTPCPMHSKWAELRSKIEWTMAHQSLAKLAEDYRAGSLRLGLST